MKQSTTSNYKTISARFDRREGLTAAFFASQEAPDWETRIGAPGTVGDDEFCVAILDGREGEDEEMLAAIEAYDKALNVVMARKSGRPVSEIESMSGEAWESFFAEWGHNLTRREKHFIEECILMVQAQQPSEGAPEKTAKSHKKMVKALGRKKKEADDYFYTEENLDVFPGTDLLADFFDREGFDYDIEPGFEISGINLNCCGDGWGPLGVRIGSTAGKDLTVISEPLEACPKKKRSEMLRLLNRFNSEDRAATAYMEEDGKIYVRWNLLCEEKDLIPTACEALGHVVDCVNELLPLLWDLLEN